MAAMANKVAQSTQPRAVVPSPAYSRPEAKMTNVMTGRM